MTFRSTKGKEYNLENLVDFTKLDSKKKKNLQEILQIQHKKNKEKMSDENAASYLKNLKDGIVQFKVKDQKMNPFKHPSNMYNTLDTNSNRLKDFLNQLLNAEEDKFTLDELFPVQD